LLMPALAQDFEVIAVDQRGMGLTDEPQENAARHDWIAEEGRPQRDIRGYYQRTSDLRISTTDPDATPMRLKG
jgi:hypothetical protein